MNNQEQQIQNVLNTLRDPRTIRTQSHRILNLAKQNRLEHFSLSPERMTTTASYIVDIITSRYPELDIPYHSRWRHFEMDGLPRIHNLRKQLEPISPSEWGKILYELVIISVFLDAGAGPLWRYKEALTKKEYSRSEGLAWPVYTSMKVGHLALTQLTRFAWMPSVCLTLKKRSS